MQSVTAAAHVGRIGGLAIALGVGAAVVAGTGVAWADADPDSPTSSEQTSAAGPADAGAATSPRRGPRSAAARATSRPAPLAARPTSSRASLAVPPPAATNRSASSSVLPAKNNAPERIGAPLPASSAPVSVAALPDTTPPKLTAALPAPSVTITPVTAPAPAAPIELLAASAPVPAAPQPAPARAMRAPTRLLATAGLDGPLASGSPGTLFDAPALWALMAFSRRELGQVGSRAAAQPSATVAAAVVATPSNLPSVQRGWVTGQRNSAFPGATWTQVNNTRWANVYGTDLGIMWVNGDNGLTQLAFGDTFSGVNMTGDWRSNVLLLSDDTELYDGLSLINTGPAFQFIPAARNQVFFIGSEVTNIPTAAVYANGENYVNYMSVKSWDSPGRWTTNYSAISMYDENTDKWVLQRSTVRSAGWFRSSTPYVAGSQNFQQMAYVLQPESQVAPGETRYVYAFGTPAGRQGSAYLSRVPEGAMTDLGQYEYWDGDSWILDKPAVATEVIGTSKSSGLFGFVKDLANNPRFFGGWFAGLFGAKTGGNVSEMSVQYNEYLDKYVVLYGNGANNVILRTADTPEGPWSDPVTLATSIQYPGLYAPMIHPLSGTGELTDANGDPDVANLYWNMSIWSNYNVVLMQTDLSPLAPVTVL